MAGLFAVWRAESGRIWGSNQAEVRPPERVINVGFQRGCVKPLDDAHDAQANAQTEANGQMTQECSSAPRFPPSAGSVKKNAMANTTAASRTLDRARQDVFVTTHWSVVLAAGSGQTLRSRQALEELCRTYWFPLYAYVRHRVRVKEDAEDLTQEFFRQLLERRWIEDVDPAKGRLRAFLITAMKHFLAKEWRRASAQKRGGDQARVPIDTRFADSRYSADPTPALDADAVFDRQWALTLLDRSLRRLETEYAAAGKSAEFSALKDFLVATRQALDYAAVAAALGCEAGAARVAVHRLRKRFRVAYREEVAETLPPGADLEDELRHLATSLARP